MSATPAVDDGDTMSVSDELDDNGIEAKVSKAIADAIDTAITNGIIANEEDAFVVLHPSGHISVTPKSEAGEIASNDADDEEPLAPFQLPSLYQEAEGKESLADQDHYQDHLASHWGF